jgi:hypothetical protein
MTTSETDFDIAKAVADKLKGIEKERQERIFRWVAESLGIQFGAALPAEQRAEQAASATSPRPNDLQLLERHERLDIKSFVDTKKLQG